MAGLETDIAYRRIRGNGIAAGAMLLGNDAAAQFCVANAKRASTGCGCCAAVSASLDARLAQYATGDLAYGGVKNSVTLRLVNVTGGSLLGVIVSSTNSTKLGRWLLARARHTPSARTGR
ncbi:MAG: hypothetical protein H6871_01410 [Methylobacteriaceae bacterium]|nr:hypothetical protein [Methylobacteriaceae bacterium]